MFNIGDKVQMKSGRYGPSWMGPMVVESYNERARIILAMHPNMGRGGFDPDEDLELAEDGPW